MKIYKKITGPISKTALLSISYKYQIYQYKDINEEKWNKICLKDHIEQCMIQCSYTISETAH